MINFRAMRIADLESVIRIEQLVFPHPWPREVFSEDILHDAFVMADDYIVAGYIFCMIALNECSIVNIAVNPAYQRQGLGETMLHQTLDLLALRGIDTYFLDVRQANFTAQRLYRKLGFRAIAIRKGYYTHPDEDAIVMTLVISEPEGLYEKL